MTVTERDFLAQKEYYRDQMRAAQRYQQAKQLPDWAETALSAQSITNAGLFKPDTVRQLRQAHQSGQPGLGALLMGVLSTQTWHDSFIVS